MSSIFLKFCLFLRDFLDFLTNVGGKNGKLKVENGKLNCGKLGFNGEDATSSDAYGATFPSRGRLIWNTVSSIEVKFTVFFCETNNLIKATFYNRGELSKQPSPRGEGGAVGVG